MHLPLLKIVLKGKYENPPRAIQVQIASLTLWFFYEAPVAFYHSSTGMVVCENYTKRQTLGLVLNIIDNDDVDSRLPKEQFDTELKTLIDRIMPE